MAITIRDVARQAGVGVGTVSRVLNNSPLVSEVTRRKVLAVIAELDYRPSPVARSLSSGRTRTIGVIAAFFTRPAFVEKLRGVEAVLAQSQYDLVLFNVETPAQRDEYFRSVPRRERVDGLIVISLPPDDHDVTRFRQAGIPILLVDTRHPALSHVVIDDVAGGRMATQHLIDLGHRRIAFVGDVVNTPFRFTSSRDRYQGYCEALAQAGIPVRSEYYKQGPHGRHVAHRLTEELLALPDPPTAIFAASDTQAMGVMEAARAAGFRVPEDLSIVGYDDIEVAPYLGLTTVHQPMYQMGMRGVELLLEVVEEPKDGPVVEVLPVELVVRSSTAPPLS